MTEPPDFDVTVLAGERFTAKSGNTAVVQILGDRGIRLKWARAASEEDQRAAEAWVRRTLRMRKGHTVSFVEGTKGIDESWDRYTEFLKRGARR